MPNVNRTTCHKVPRRGLPDKSDGGDTVEPRLTTTPLKRPPRYYNLNFVPRTKLMSSHFFSFTTLLIRPPGSVITTTFSLPDDCRINGVPLYLLHQIAITAQVIMINMIATRDI